MWRLLRLRWECPSRGSWFVVALNRLCARRSHRLMQNYFALCISINCIVVPSVGNPFTLPHPLMLPYAFPFRRQFQRTLIAMFTLLQSATKCFPPFFTYTLCKPGRERDRVRKREKHRINERARQGWSVYYSNTAVAVTAMSDLLGQLSALSATRSLTNW